MRASVYLANSTAEAADNNVEFQAGLPMARFLKAISFLAVLISAYSGDLANSAYADDKTAFIQHFEIRIRQEIANEIVHSNRFIDFSGKLRALIMFELDNSNNVSFSKVLNTSGNKAFDSRAIDVVKKAVRRLPKRTHGEMKKPSRYTLAISNQGPH